MGHRNRARQRHKKFKQTKVQTFGGKKTNFSNAEKKRITDAGYSVQGYSSAPAKSGTDAMVARDNQMYGNTFPSGSFSISPAGRRQAEANRKAAAAKKAAAARKEATRKSTFDANRLSFNMENNPFTGQSFLAGGYNQPGRLGSWFDKGLNIRVPNEASASFGRLVKDDFAQLGKFTDKSGKIEGGLFGSGIPKNFRQVKQLFTGKGGLGFSFGSGIGTGPTPLGRQAVRRFLPYAGQISLGRDIFNQGATDSATANLMNNINTGVTNLTGGRLTANNPETDIGARAGRFFTSLPGKIVNAFTGGDDAKVASAGGLNIGGGVDSGDAPKSNVGRVLTFGKNLVQQPKALAAFGVDVANQLFSPKLADGTLTGNMDFAGNLPGDKGFDNRDVQIKSAVNNAMDSNFVQQYGENLGLPKNFKAQTKDALAALGENYQGATADRDGIYKGTSETLKNLSSDKRLAPIAKYLNQLGTDNENVTDADRNQKFSMMGFPTPFTNEQAADAITAFQPNVQGMAGLSRADRGLIEGSGGNRIISGKLTDIAREAITGNIGTGDSLGIQKGTPLTIGNMLDAGSTIASNLQQDGTLASQRSAEIGRLADKAGKITTPSLIKGLIPRFGGSGSFRPNAVSSLGAGATTLAAATPTSTEEVLPLPTTATQTGTDSGNLASIMQNAYANQMSLYGMNPNYFANIMQPRFNRPMRRFRQVFNRDYY
tara:strand:- start:43 stop:2181 length:2139 start_codon:yes stop_codon:yes gene_type:complete